MFASFILALFASFMLRRLLWRGDAAPFAIAYTLDNVVAILGSMFMAGTAPSAANAPGRCSPGSLALCDLQRAPLTPSQSRQGRASCAMPCYSMVGSDWRGEGNERPEGGARRRAAQEREQTGEGHGATGLVWRDGLSPRRLLRPSGPGRWIAVPQPPLVGHVVLLVVDHLSVFGNLAQLRWEPAVDVVVFLVELPGLAAALRASA